MVNEVFSAPNYSVHLAQCMLMDWIFRYNMNRQAVGTKPVHYDIALVADIRKKYEALNIESAYADWSLAPETTEQFGLLWETQQDSTSEAALPEPEDLAQASPLGEDEEDNNDVNIDEFFPPLSVLVRLNACNPDMLLSIIYVHNA